MDASTSGALNQLRGGLHTVAKLMAWSVSECLLEYMTHHELTLEIDCTALDLKGLPDYMLGCLAWISL